MQEERVAIVTGGAHGIGFAVASELAGKGYRVVIVDSGVTVAGRDGDPGSAAAAARRLAATGAAAEGISCDVSDTRQTGECLAEVSARHGRVDVLANVAGILRPGPFLADTAETWAVVMSTHLGGHLNTIAAVLPGMLARGSGRIINVTSTAALMGSRRQPAYSSAKQAIVGLTRHLAVLLESSGVTVNAIAPAAVTRMSAGLPADHDEGLAIRMPELRDRDARHIGRFASWLAGPGAGTVSGRLFLTSGHYVIEYEHLRLRKWAAIPPPGTPAALAECMRWVIGRPHPEVIGPWPTRDFTLTPRERQWEGTSIGPDLLAGIGRGGPATGPVTMLGAEGEQAAAVLSGMRETVAVAEDAPADGTAAGALVFAPGTDVMAPARGAAAGPEMPEPAAVCAQACRLLSLVRSALARTAHDDGRAAVLVLPGWLPWSDPGADLACWLAWYAAAGLVRGAAATEAMYGVRVNGLVLEPGAERQAGQVAAYLLSPSSSWLNGYLLTADGRGVGLLSDESPRWQVFGTDSDFPFPPGLAGELGVGRPG